MILKIVVHIFLFSALTDSNSCWFGSFCCELIFDRYFFSMKEQNAAQVVIIMFFTNSVVLV